MSLRYARPAVTLERADANASAPVVLRTDIAAFAGIARRGPLDTPVPLESFRQFAAHFGEFTGAGYLAYAVRGFFDNGGRRCWVVRVASTEEAGGARAASLTVNGIDGAPALTVSASSPGTWGNALTLEWMAESGATAVAHASAGIEHFVSVGSTAGFERGTLVRIEQLGKPVQHRVVAEVDATARRIYWIHPQPGRGQPTDAALTGTDPGQPLRITRLAYGLTVREGGRVRAVYRDLSLVRGRERSMDRVLGERDLRPRWLRQGEAEMPADLPRAPEPVMVRFVEQPDYVIPVPLDLAAGGSLALGGGTDGLSALGEYDFLGEPVAPEDSDFVRARKLRGLQTLAGCDEIGLVAMPDILIVPDPDPQYVPQVDPPENPCLNCRPPAPPRNVHQPLPAGDLPAGFDDAAIARMQAALVRHCEDEGFRFAILSLPEHLADDARRSREELLAWRDAFDSRQAALYLPWLEVVEPRATAPTRRVPACGHLCGAIARTDLSSGVQRAPGNLPLEGVTDLGRLIDDTDHGEFNLAGLNVLRGEFGRPRLVGGARTLSRDPDWRFINVSRLVLTIERAMAVLLRDVVFEPNDASTRAAVHASLSVLLQGFFERGAFRGATPEESYYVRCDAVTTPEEEADLGRLIALVGIAPAAPCEFIVLRVGREHNTLSVTLFQPDEVRP